MFDKIKNLLFNKKKLIDNKAPTEDTMIDVIVSLNKNFEISIKLFLDDQINNKNISQAELALVYAEFLNIIMSGKTKSQILDIIMNQIKNPSNEQLINSILSFLNIMDKSTQTNNIPIIKPTQVFAKYKNG